MNIDRNQLMAILEAFEDEMDFTIRHKVKLADRIIDGLGPRHLVSVCCYCGKEYNRQPLPENYGKELPAKYHTGDLLSHGICSGCMPGLARE